ncbi:MAG TPA: hypothetical protein PLQ19_09980 [Aeromicrobium sp.]|nr:hypothetical protein [Aeromicrobium sp.]
MNEMDVDQPVVVDCDTCLVRCAAVCADCVVSVLLGPPPERLEFDPHEQAALTALAGTGLIPPLRLVASVPALQEGDLGFTAQTRDAAS